MYVECTMLWVVDARALCQPAVLHLLGHSVNRTPLHSVNSTPWKMLFVSFSHPLFVCSTPCPLAVLFPVVLLCLVKYCFYSTYEQNVHSIFPAIQSFVL